MQYKSGRRFWRWLPALVFVSVWGLAAVAVFRISFAARNGDAPMSQQDVIRLDSRFSQLETRLNFLENRLRSIEQQSRLGDSRGVTQSDWTVLRSELQTLQQRVAEYECALAKLDERTLAPNVRAGRRRSESGSDPCRANFDLPIRLPSER
jgi:BMFP domain-containing protein YqiC